MQQNMIKAKFFHFWNHRIHIPQDWIVLMLLVQVFGVKFEI